MLSDWKSLASFKLLVLTVNEALLLEPVWQLYVAFVKIHIVDGHGPN